jgi:hypothetical protein
MNEQQMSDMAQAIYDEVFDIPDKVFQPAKVQEIYEWLVNGDLVDDPDLDTLVAEWREYDAEDVARIP